MLGILLVSVVGGIAAAGAYAHRSAQRNFPRATNVVMNAPRDVALAVIEVANFAEGMGEEIHKQVVEAWRRNQQAQSNLDANARNR